MRILITGAAGMLGTDVCQVFSELGHDVTGTDVAGAPERLDITDAEAVSSAFARLSPEVVVHCAAYTNVDGAERESDAAYRVNGLGTWCVAAACARHNCELCAISTDFVFDGAKDGPYTEYDTPNPLSIYGASKLAGEAHVRALCRKHWIVRSAWLFGLHGKCFPATILDAARAGRQLRVVADQTGCPTYTSDLAQALARIIESPLYGTYHVTNSGIATWYEVAQRTLQLAGLDPSQVAPITASGWPSPARRPANSVLRPLAMEMQGMPLLRPWPEALADFVHRRHP